MLSRRMPGECQQRLIRLNTHSKSNPPSVGLPCIVGSGLRSSSCPVSLWPNCGGGSFLLGVLGGVPCQSEIVWRTTLTLGSGVPGCLSVKDCSLNNIGAVSLLGTEPGSG